MVSHLLKKGFVLSIAGALSFAAAYAGTKYHGSMLENRLSVAGTLSAAEEYTTVTITEAGTLKNLLTDEMYSSVTHLKVVGPMNYADFYPMFKFTSLVALDLSLVNIVDDGNGVANYLPKSAIDGMTGVKEIKLPQTITGIGAYAFRNTGLEKIEIPEGITEIGAGICLGCKSLTDVVLPESLLEVSRNAFSSCTSLVNVKFSSKTTLIKEGAFMGCSSLASIELPETLQELEYGAFKETAITDAVIGKNVVKMGSLVFGSAPLSTVTCYAVNPPEMPYDGFDEDIYMSATLYIPEGSFDMYMDEVGWGQFTSVKDITGGGGTVDPGDEYTTFTITEAGTLKTLFTDDLYSSVTHLRIVGPMNYADFYPLFKFTSLVSLDLSLVNIVDDGNGVANYLPKSAVDGMTGLKEIILPQTITGIGAYAFRNTGLERIEIPEGITEMGAGICLGCKSLTDVVLPESLVEVGRNAFSSCTSLVNVKFSSKTTLIKEGAFMGCSSLASVNLPGTLQELEYGAFKETAITDAVIGKNVVKMGSLVFGSAPLSTVTCYAVNPPEMPYDGFDEDIYMSATLYIPEGSFDMYMDEVGWGQFTTVKDITGGGGTVDPDGYVNVETQQAGTLAELLKGFDVATVTKLRIEGNIDNNDIEAIKQCTALEVLDLAGAVIVNDGKNRENATPERAFSGYASLREVKLPSSLVILGAETFKGSVINAVTLPSTLTTVETGAFMECLKLETLVVPAGVMEIPSSAFEGCTSLSGIVLPVNVKTIGDKAFMGCSALAAFGMPSDIETIGAEAFKNTALKEVGFGSNAKSIGSEAFAGLQITKITPLGAVPPEMPQDAFDSSVYETAVVVLAGAYEKAYKEHPVWKLFKNYDITYGPVVDPDGYTRINCPEAGGLLEVLTGDIRTSVVKLRITGVMNREDFLELKNAIKLEMLDLTDVKIEASSSNPERFPADELPKRCFQSTSTIKQVILPSTIVSIGDESFQESSIEEIVIPENVKTVGTYVFHYSTKLVKAEIKANLVETGRSMFSGCSSLSEVVLPASLKTLGETAFYNCTSLKSIELPKGLEVISSDAFYGAGIEQITLPESVNTIGETAFAGSSIAVITCLSAVAPDAHLNAFDERILGETKLRFHKASYDSYMDHVVWSQFVKWEYIEGAVEDNVAGEAKFTVTEAGLVLNAEAADIKVYNMHGAVVASRRNVAEGEQVALTDTGIYVVVVDGVSYKVFVR